MNGGFTTDLAAAARRRDHVEPLHVRRAQLAAPTTASASSARSRLTSSARRRRGGGVARQQHLGGRQPRPRGDGDDGGVGSTSRCRGRAACAPQAPPWRARVDETPLRQRHGAPPGSPPAPPRRPAIGAARRSKLHTPRRDFAIGARRLHRAPHLGERPFSSWSANAAADRCGHLGFRRVRQAVPRRVRLPAPWPPRARRAPPRERRLPRSFLYVGAVSTASHGAPSTPSISSLLIPRAERDRRQRAAADELERARQRAAAAARSRAAGAAAAAPPPPPPAAPGEGVGVGPLDDWHEHLPELAAGFLSVFDVTAPRPRAARAARPLGGRGAGAA